MKNYYFLLIFFIIVSCSSSKQVYWCGDHPCINKKEKISYFKETMIVEIKQLDKKKIRKNSEIEKITQQARLDEKKRIKEEKVFAKQEIERNKKTIKQKEVKQDADIAKIDVSSNNVFKKIVEKITKENMFRPYPNINDIPN